MHSCFSIDLAGFIEPCIYCNAELLNGKMEFYSFIIKWNFTELHNL